MSSVLYILQPILLLALLAAWIYCLGDTLRNHRSLVWLGVLLLVPVLPIPFYLVNFKVFGAPDDGRIDGWLRATWMVRRLRREVAESDRSALRLALAEGLIIAARPEHAREALSALGKVLETDPEDVQAHFLAGRALLMIGEPARARQHFEYVIERDAEYRRGEARLGLARAHEALGEKALAEAEIALIASRHLLPEAFVRHARVLRARGERDNARAVLQDLLSRAAEMGGDDRRLHRAWLRVAERELREL